MLTEDLELILRFLLHFVIPYLEQNGSLYLQETQVVLDHKNDAFLRKKLCPWDKNWSNIFLYLIYHCSDNTVVSISLS